MKKRIFASILAVTSVVLIISLFLTIGVSYRYFQGVLMEDMERSTAYIAHAVEREGVGYLSSGLPDNNRVTWIAADGTVLFDTWEDVSDMGDHSDREEVQTAFAQGHGTAIRYSDTLDTSMVYYALRLSDGSVLRASDTRESVLQLMGEVIRPMLLVMLLAFCAAMWMARRISRQLVAPINAIDLNDPSDEDVYDELAPFLTRIRSQNRQIRRQMEELRRQQQEFEAITRHMSEGLLVIDTELRVLSYNPAALRLLNAAETAREGVHVLELNREAGFRRCVESALQGVRREELLEREDGCRSVLASPVEQDDQLTGAVLVIMDVTEKAQREQLRREFTANVSHELKTPLTAILGTAEILQNGMVKPEDAGHFAGNIYREAQRLIGLVNDIIKLSRLDEGAMGEQWQPVELYGLAAGVRERLAAAAAMKDVTITLAGQPAEICSVPAIVEEILYNLCDNAVAYNRPGGSVAVTVEHTAEGARVSVADTGIGIPAEARERIFERFYRVDKSHSGGGTGLGLSIVKHGAAYLQARVEVDSEPGKGSTFTVTFPKGK